jgi:prephenate dehydrogenase/chorismate mutase/prephenate dehydrogenase
MVAKDRLQQIDQSLIRLLKERISVLAESGSLSVEEQLSSCKSLLAQFGIPEATWQSIITSCVASVNITPSIKQEIQPRKVTIIGGGGMMGRFFVERLMVAGHQVDILEYSDWGQADRLLGEADLVLVCVPLKNMLAVIRKASQYLSPSTTLVDIASTKVPIVQTMLECHKGPVLGLHPMFGPGVKSFLAQKIVVCPSRNREAFQWFLDFIESDGGKLVTCTPEEHDQMMVSVQVIRHFAAFGLGVFFCEEDIDISRTLEFASPIYRIEMNMIGRLFAQDASLYIDIMLASESRCQAIRRLADTFKRLAECIAQGNRAALVEEFEAAREIFKEEGVRSLKESNYMINSFSTLLAAHNVEAQKAVVGLL